MKEKRSDSDLRVRSYVWIEGLELNLVDATENEYGDGVGKGGCVAGDLGVDEGDASDTILWAIISTFLSFIILSFFQLCVTQKNSVF